MKTDVIPPIRLRGQQQIDFAISKITGIAPEDDIQIRFEVFEEDRNEAQNKLMWHWNREVGEQTHNEPDWVHGESKKEILLPLMKSWGGRFLKRANFIDEVLRSCTSYKIKVGVSYDMVRTRPPALGVRKMAIYLTEYRKHYQSGGIFLTNSDDYDLAMGVR